MLCRKWSILKSAWRIPAGADLETESAGPSMCTCPCEFAHNAFVCMGAMYALHVVCVYVYPVCMQAVCACTHMHR